ncbi:MULTISPECIES: SSI family serine proteinase inhibitor [Actinoalloteichus]|uniref:Subtilisin inhibitor-like protein n=1 Tax=Actinoalloteichus fjordicus TaxID=1612552 RepID=A0AAC9LGN3_9PSEU|nr:MULTISPECIES: SSI family serine proteinase inhibitor [Actinoalloteichus]APU17247.1 subtilisin inhibitor-like protein [Actinoalloteichus fjordicus]APU23330.1 subtilisin inhibitor-like protein [Actinoalloteichus sp. GBA129-24]
MSWHHLVASAMFAAASVLTGATDPSGGAPAADTTDAQIPTTLTLTISQDPLAADQDATGRRSAVLTCDPDGGNHPDPATACSDLKLVGDRFEGIANQEICTMIYQPHTVTATGTVEGKPVAIERTYSNKCVLAAETGEIFAF